MKKIFKGGLLGVLIPAILFSLTACGSTSHETMKPTPPAIPKFHLNETKLIKNKTALAELELSFNPKSQPQQNNLTDGRLYTYIIRLKGKGGVFELNPQMFTLITDKGNKVAALITGAKTPALSRIRLKANRKFFGHIAFDVPKGEAPTAISLVDADFIQVVAKWKLK